MAIPTRFDSPDNDQQQPGSFDWRVRTLLTDFKDDVWHDSRILGIQTLAETNRGTDNERAVHAMGVALENALHSLPEDQRNEYRDRAWNRLNDDLERHPTVPLQQPASRKPRPQGKPGGGVKGKIQQIKRTAEDKLGKK